MALIHAFRGIMNKFIVCLLLVFHVSQVSAHDFNGAEVKVIRVIAKDASFKGELQADISREVYVDRDMSALEITGQVTAFNNDQIDWMYLVYSQGNYLVFTKSKGLLTKKEWLKDLCDSLSANGEPLEMENGEVGLKTYKEAFEKLKDAICVSASSLRKLLTDYVEIAFDLEITSRNSSISLYEAYSSIRFLPGFSTESGANFTARIVGAENPSMPTDLNWIQVKSFDENGNTIDEGKEFFDYNGQLIQSQVKVKHQQKGTQVLAVQPLYDAYGRPAGNTLPAPIMSSELQYKPDFVQNASGGLYDYKNFDRYTASGAETDKTNSPDPVGGQQTPGTLGWYYSINNSMEPYTSTTSYPYIRQSFYRDGNGKGKKMSGIGEVFKMGSGHEMSGFQTRVVNELNHYLSVRNKYFVTAEVGALPSTLIQKTIQSVVLDANGKQGITISDKDGGVLLTARPGTGNLQTDLLVSNSIPLSSHQFVYFSIFSNNTPVTITGSGYTLLDMNTEMPTTLVGGNSLNKGYYKLVTDVTQAEVTLSYTNWYTDISYSFYNQLGQLVASIAPEGVKKLLGTGINNYVTRSSVPFIELYEYDVQGRMVKQSSTDGGASEMVYRKDGKIRFSQNAEQKVSGKYDYINYDRFGRVVEYGEYQPETGGIAFTSDMGAASPMKDILEDVSSGGGLIHGVKRDFSVITYDIVDNSHNVTGYLQDAANLGSSISRTSKYDIVWTDIPNSGQPISSHWYNYDEEGKVTWIIQFIAGLGYKTTDYEYDVLGNLVKKIFQKGATDMFIHYYEYDPLNKQLYRIWTNTEESSSNKRLQATYLYYLHGPLKRVILGDDLQGTDYTYTLQGALKAINNSDKTKDPGGDGENGVQADAFGMVLDYHAGDYSNDRTGIRAIKGVNASGIVADSYNGQIKAMSWFSKKPPLAGLTDDPLTYVYKYDDKYQFSESVWGNYTPAPNDFVGTSFNKETIKHPINGSSAYDANGNIQYLQRTNGVGAIADKFTYNYQSNTNKLSSIINDASGSAQTHASYTYDLNGQLVLENTGDPAQRKYIKYDASGKVVLVARDATFTQRVVAYRYDESGQRILKILYNSSWQPAQETYYVGDVIYTRDIASMIVPIPQEYAIEGGNGRLGTYYKQSNVYAYELNDHLGNVRAVVARSGSSLEVRMYADYYPYGMVIQKSGDYRHGYQGQYSEKDGETDWNAFELRMYDSRIARWLSVDPANEFWSPYVGMGNDPINNTDPDGGCTKCEADKFSKTVPNGRVEANPSGGYLVYYDTDGGMAVRKFNSNFNSLDRVGWGVWVDRQVASGITQDQMMMWLDKEHLSSASFIKFSDASSPVSVRIRQAEEKSWKVQGEIAKQIGWSLLPWGRVLKLAGKAGQWVAFGSGKGRLFWSSTGAQSGIGSAGHLLEVSAKWAAQNGGRTLEMTRGGKALSFIQKTFKLSRKQADPLWAILSRQWAKGVKGPITVFQGPVVRLEAQWVTKEFGNLPLGTEINFFGVGW